MATKEEIKILMITARADYGGGPEHLYQLLSLHTDFNLFVAVPKDEPYFKKYQEIVGSNNLFIIPHRKFRLKKLFELISFVKTQRISIIHSHGKGAGIYSRLIALFSKSKCVHTFHGLHISNYNFLFKHLYINLEKILSYFTDRLITVSISEKSKILSMKLTREEKLILIENGVKIPQKIKTPAEKYESNKIIHVSRFDYAKNSLLLLEIIRELNKYKEAEKLDFHIIGDGPDRILLQNRCRKEEISNVVFHGFQSNVGQFYSDSFCYISTSRWEGLPLSLLESMSFGTPSVVTDVDGNKDLVSHGENGYLFDIDKPQQAEEYILKLSDDAELYRRLSQNARQLITDNYSISNMIKQTKDLYLSLV